jgi:hypothetical protein
MSVFPQIQTQADALNRLTDPGFVSTVRDYFNYRHAKPGYTENKWLEMSDADVIKSFYDNRQKWNNNSAFILGDALSVSGEEDQVRKDQFAHIQRVYDLLPMPWNDPNTKFSQWGFNILGAAIYDPLNYVSGPIGKQITKSAVKQSLKLALKDKVRKEISKELLEEAIDKTGKELLGKKSTLKLIAPSVVTGATFSGGFDALMQYRDIESGAQSEFDFRRSALSAFTGGVLIAPFSALFGRQGVKMSINDLREKSLKELTNFDFYARSAVTGETVFKALDEKVFTNIFTPKSFVHKVKNYFEEDEGLILYDDANEPQIYKLNKSLDINEDGKIKGTGNKIPGVTNIVKVKGISDSTVKFPKTLGSPKPRYKGGQIAFNNDLEKAIYIVGSKTKRAKRYDEFLDFALAHSGKTKEEIIEISTRMRQTLAIAFKNEGHLPLVSSKQDIAKAWYNDANVKYNKERQAVIDETLKVGPDEKPPKTLINITKEIMPDRTQAGFISRYSQSVIDDITQKGPALKSLAAEINAGNLDEIMELAKAIIENPGKLAQANIGASALRNQLWHRYKDLILKSIDGLPEKEAAQLRTQKIEAIKEYIQLVRIEHLIKKEISLALNASKLQAQDLNIDELQQRAIQKGIAKILKETGETDAKFFDDLAGGKAHQDKFDEIITELDDPEALIKLIDSDVEFGTWDKVNSYLTNNILTNTATQMITVVGNATNVVRRPLEKYLKVLPLSFSDTIAAKEAWREANSQFVHYIYNASFALKRAYKSVKHYRPILDQKIMKFGDVQLQNQYNDFLKSFTPESFRASKGYLDFIFKGEGRTAGSVARGAARVTADALRWTHTSGTRIMGGIDEFFKNTTYRAHAMIAIQTIIEREHPELISKNSLSAADALYNNKRYKELAEEYLKRFYNADGSARPWDDILNDDLIGHLFKKRQTGQSMQPLENARLMSNQDRGIVTSINKNESGRYVMDEIDQTWTQGVVEFSSKNKWTKPLGLLYINTPGSLLRAEFQRFPVLGKFQNHMKQMLRKGPDGKYLHPEEAAEAIARQSCGIMVWTAAVWLALYRPDVITGGGIDKGRFPSKQRKLATGEEPYSIAGVTVNKLDILAPFFAAKDLVDFLQASNTYHSDLSPKLQQNTLEFATGMIWSITKNLGSKVFLRNILEFASTVVLGDFSDGKTQGKFSMALSSITKGFVPLSGILQQVDAGTDSIEREMYSFWDSLTAVNPFDEQSKISPLRSWTGEIVERKQSILFGPATDRIYPFSVRKENKIINQFFKERRFDYQQQSQWSPSGQNLKELRIKGVTYVSLPPDENGKTIKIKITNQTLYDKWMELKSNVTFPIKTKTGATKKVRLQQYLEYLISNPDSVLHKFDAGVIASMPSLNSPPVMEDSQQNFILGIIRQAEEIAYKELLRDYGNVPLMDQNGKTFNQLEKETTGNIIKSMIGD